MRLTKEFSTIKVEKITKLKLDALKSTYPWLSKTQIVELGIELAIENNGIITKDDRKRTSK